MKPVSLGSSQEVTNFCVISTDADDFDGAEKTVEFPVDEGRTLVEQITAFIPITDDDIDEADQLFVVIIADVMGAVDASRIVLGRNTSLCRITDNDGKAFKN